MSKTLVYFHGGACSKLDIAGVYERPEFQDYEILVPDFPGCGHAAYEGGPLDMMDLVMMMESFLKNVEMPVIVGHSTGGLLGLLYSERNPVSAFISVEGNLTLANCNFSSKVVQQSREEFLEEGVLEMLKMLEGSGNKGFLHWAHSIREWSDMGAFYDYCVDLVKYCREANLLERYKALDCPKLYIYGDANSALPFLNELETIEIAGSDHFPMIDNPEEFYVKIASFLEKL